MSKPKPPRNPDGLSPLFDLDIDALLSSPESLTASRTRRDTSELESELDTTHLQALGRDLAAQYANTIGDYAVSVFSREDSEKGRLQVRAAITSMLDLANATSDAALVRTLTPWLPLLDAPSPRKTLARTRQIKDLKAMVKDFASLLDEQEQQQLLSIVQYRGRSSPLMAFLRQLPGIGPRRLERMFLAGLHDLDRLCTAEPDELQRVTGMPLAVAQNTCRSARVFAEEERKRAFHALTERAAWLTESVGKLNMADPEQRRLIEFARQAMNALQEQLNARDPS
ncbi:MAG: helix-hairpin-helix domain-containing protein [Myxococcota bacterium]